MAGGRLVEAAGAIVLRRPAGKQVQVLLIHRPSYNDWSLPKGKLDPDEYLPAAAVRETVEETAAVIRLVHPVDRIQYPIPTGAKRVAYWLGVMTAAKDGGLYLTYAGGTQKSFRSDTAPGFFSMLTGQWADQYGITDNEQKKEVEPLTCLGELAKQGKAVSFLVQWPTHINVQYKAEIDWAKENHYPLTASSSENDPALAGPGAHR